MVLRSDECERVKLLPLFHREPPEKFAIDAHTVRPLPTRILSMSSVPELLVGVAENPRSNVAPSGFLFIEIQASNTLIFLPVNLLGIEIEHEPLVQTKLSPTERTAPEDRRTTGSPPKSITPLLRNKFPTRVSMTPAANVAFLVVPICNAFENLVPSDMFQMGLGSSWRTRSDMSNVDTDVVKSFGTP